MIKTLAFLAGVLAVLACATSRSFADPFALQEGDHVVMYGDSITEQRLYTNYVEIFVCTRFPHLTVDWTNSGWGGDRVSGGAGGPIDLRIKRDILAYHPTVVTLMLGMNDGEYRPFDETLYDTYVQGINNIVATVKAQDPGVRFTIIAPSPYDDIDVTPQFYGGYNGVLLTYGRADQRFAMTDGDIFADFNKPLVDVLLKAKQTDPATAVKIIPGRVHPSNAGHLIMAEALLKAWNAPSQVSSVAIDVSSKTIAEVDGASISKIVYGDDSVKWDELDQCLPFPIDMTDPATALVVKCSDIVDALDQEPLQVMGLAPGNYDLTIDGQPVGTFSAGQLSTGINLALQPTPMMLQAMSVSTLVFQQNDLHHQWWRDVQMKYAGVTDPSLTDIASQLSDSLTSAEARTMMTIRHLNKPVMHHFAIKPSSGS